MPFGLKGWGLGCLVETEEWDHENIVLANFLGGGGIGCS